MVSCFLGKANAGLTDKKILVACMTFGFVVRLVPELLAFPLPIGFDTVYYASAIKNGVILANWSSFFTSTWLLNGLTVPLYSAFNLDPFMLLKIVAPLLYGLNTAGIYWFANKTLGWSQRKSIFAMLFFSLQLASLRISWDLLRNTLGLGILMFTLALVKNARSNKEYAIFGLLCLLTIFAHELAAVTLLTIILGLAIWRAIKKQINPPTKLLLSAVPAFSVFFSGLFLRVFPVIPQAATNLTSAGDSVGAHPGNFFFLVNYLRVHTSVDYYLTYADLAVDIAILSSVLFLPYLFLTIKGWFRNDILNLWSGLLMFGAFGCLLIPFCALEYWHRWLFMLAYPFTFYAVNGFTKFRGKLPKMPRKAFFFTLLSNKKATAIVLLTFALGVAYLITPASMVYAGTSVPSASGTYLYFSTSPTVPYEDINSVIHAMNWLNKQQMDESSSVILHDAFLSWGQLTLDKSKSIICFINDSRMALETALSYGYQSIFFVWWNKPIGWYGISVPPGFVSVQDFGRISIYKYVGENFVGS